MSRKKLKFSLSDFGELDLSNLFINCFSYNDNDHLNCPICKQYEK